MGVKSHYAFQVNLPAVSTRIARLVLRAALGDDVDRDALLQRCEIAPELLDDIDGAIGLRPMNALWNAAAQACGGEAVGLRVLNLAEPGELGVLEQLVPTYLSVGEALAGFVEHQAVLQKNLGRWSLTPEHDAGQLLRLEFLSERLPVHDWVAEFALASLLRTLSAAAGGDARWGQVSLRGPEPSDSDSYRAVFGDPVRFGAEYDSILFTDEQVNRQLRGENAPLRTLLEGLAQQQAQNIVASSDAPWVDAVSGLLARRLQDITVGQIAARLGTSERSLRRKLSQSGTSFTEVLDRTRRDKAETYLQDDKLAIQEIAFLLGFSEVASFNRAFRRWHNQAPRSYRDQLRSQSRS